MPGRGLSAWCTACQPRWIRPPDRRYATGSCLPLGSISLKGRTLSDPGSSASSWGRIAGGMPQVWPAYHSGSFTRRTAGRSPSAAAAAVAAGGAGAAAAAAAAAALADSLAMRKRRLPWRCCCSCTVLPVRSRSAAEMAGQPVRSCRLLRWMTHDISAPRGSTKRRRPSSGTRKVAVCAVGMRMLCPL